MKLSKSGVVCIHSCESKTQGGKYGHEDIQADPTRDAEISPLDKLEAYHNLDAEERGQDRREGRKAACYDCALDAKRIRINGCPYPHL